jgi:phosphate transport system ATP-binding protein
METRGLEVWAGKRLLLRPVDVSVDACCTLALVGPSGVGKSTFLRCLNRLVELSPALSVRGEILLRGSSIFHRDVDVDNLRARIGMLFQQPAIFPCSIRDNVLFGACRLNRLSRRQGTELSQRVLLDAGLWDEVKDRLGENALSLSVGQQQRLCLARALAVEPEVLLLDEPTSALDPESTERIERLILNLSQQKALVLVTHDHAQAERVAGRIVRMELRDGAGEVVEIIDRCE